jgi:hypothetical protein
VSEDLKESCKLNEENELKKPVEAWTTECRCER